MADLGPHFPQIRQMLLGTGDQALNLADQPWFMTLLRQWPENEGGGQSDCSEFTNLLSNWVSSSCYSCQWEQRLMQGEKVITHDVGSVNQPITIALDPELSLDGVIPLRALLRLWNNELGMQQALVQPYDVFCVHLDRFCIDPLGQLQKSSIEIGIHVGVEVPVFADDSITVEWHDYQVIALSSHTGDTLQGHYETLLKIDLPPIHQGRPLHWLHMDDNRKARACWAEPPGFTAGLTMVWLCNCRVLDLYQWFKPEEATPDLRASDMFHFLST